MTNTSIDIDFILNNHRTPYKYNLTYSAITMILNLYTNITLKFAT